MYLLDTNYCSRIITGDPQAIQAMLSHRRQGIAISVIVEGELRFMAENSELKLDNLARVQSLLERLDVCPVNSNISNTYALLKAALFSIFGPKDKAERRKLRIQTLGFDDNDLWIAVTAIHHQLILVSADRDFERIQPATTLQLESWIG
jgi:tRNA(fMet)-specific endonuclease VapC